MARRDTQGFNLTGLIVALLPEALVWVVFIWADSLFGFHTRLLKDG